MKRLSLLPLAAAVAFAQTKPATEVGATGPEAPLAPIATILLQAHPAAPTSIDDVLLAPHASAGQKAVTFEWATQDQVQAYILWDKYFAAAEYSGIGAPSAQTRASFGYMTQAFGAGAKLRYSDSTLESSDNEKAQHYYALNSIEVFGSMPWAGKDLYASLDWTKPNTNSWYDYSAVAPKEDPYTLPRTDKVGLNVGLRTYPAAGVQGSGWNAQLLTAYHYARNERGGDSVVSTAWSATLYGQYGHVFIVDGISFLPGVDGVISHYNAKSPDYLNTFAVSPNASVIVPLFEHWTLMGGARYTLSQTLNDYTVGKKSDFADAFTTSGTSGSVGLRYVRGRWAVDAAVENSFLSSGPYFISGQSPSAGMLARLGFSVNLK